MTDSTRALCALINTGNSRLINRCILAGAIDALLPYLFDSAVANTFLSMANTTKAKMRLRNYFEEICSQFLVIEDPCALIILKTINKLNVKINCPKMTKRALAWAFQEHISYYEIATFLSKIDDQRVLIEAFEMITPSLLDVNVGRQTKLLYLLARNSHRIARMIADKWGAQILQTLLTQDTCSYTISLIHWCQSYLKHSAFHENLLTLFDTEDLHLLAFRLFFHFVRVEGGQGVMERTLKCNWQNMHAAIAEKLRCLLLCDVTHSAYRTVIPSFCLMVMTADLTALSSTVVERLSEYISKHPYLFAFECDDNPTILRRIIQVGTRLNVPIPRLKPYQDRLNFVKQLEKSQQRLHAVGLQDWTPPDAFCCPVTMELMRDPVVASDGFTYERDTLTKLLTTTRCSPLTRETLNRQIMIPNINLKKRIRDLPHELCDFASEKRSRGE